MSRLYIPEQSDNEDLRQNYFNYSKVGLLDVLGTTFQQMIYENPMSSAKRSAELYFKGNSGRKLDALKYAESGEELISFMLSKRREAITILKLQKVKNASKMEDTKDTKFFPTTRISTAFWKG